MDDIIEEFNLYESEKPRIEESIKNIFNETRIKMKTDYDKKKKVLENLSKEDYDSLKNMKIYKFYPSHSNIKIKEHMVNFNHKFIKINDKILEFNCQ